MTKADFDLLLDRVSAWPPEAQNELLASVADIEARHDLVYRVTDADRAAIRRGLEDMRAGRLASDETVTALFDRYQG
ncbi:hypothetical protein [Rhodopseudomonas palustris]|uniref:Addiction module protein n=1 Tax=Rhodopseudomonas palustris TaxID=1076 RepID=A0A418VI05_RHOPL|nr:hypothetical protein [Rhodopseudomonas palustris]RJF75772.1 hypothetical protein D4Q52_08410 [Rhodopseudomonas palustris]